MAGGGGEGNVSTPRERTVTAAGVACRVWDDHAAASQAGGSGAARERSVTGPAWPAAYGSTGTGLTFLPGIGGLPRWSDVSRRLGSGDG